MSLKKALLYKMHTEIAKQAAELIKLQTEYAAEFEKLPPEDQESESLNEHYGDLHDLLSEAAEAMNKAAGDVEQALKA